MSELPLLAALVVLAFLVEAASGFGSMVVALTLGALWFDVTTLLAWLVPVNLVLSLVLWGLGRRAVSWRFLLTGLFPAMLPGLLVGSLASSLGSPAWLKPAFGAFVVVVAAGLWRNARAYTVPAPLPAWGRLAGLFGAGVIHGVFATGGPLAVFVAARELTDKAAFRATLAALWAALNLLVLARLGATGALTAATLTRSATLLPALGVGLALGEVVHRRLDEARFRVVVAGLLLVAGAVLLGTSAKELVG